ncbi:RHS repeat-associated core domain-containing protein [Gottfriedia sp. NPDC056225]|uniref:RHS repeat-associated core domain-containing protein n=1 Tax=Gottfriedia sp. NPDC056225 TaxID=3345751 RepID=UPI0035DC7EC2
MVARYYQPETGVFLSLDPEPGDEDNALTQNGFTYVSNNPLIQYIDTDGESQASSTFLSKNILE